MVEAVDIGRINVVIVERLETLRLCITCDPSDDREDLVQRFKPEGKKWRLDGTLLDGGNHVYLNYFRLTYPSSERD